MHHPTDRIAYTMAFVQRAMEHWLECEIAHRVHHEDRSDDPLLHEWMLYHEATHRSVTVGSHVLCITDANNEMFYLTTHSTHFIYGYMVSVMPTMTHTHVQNISTPLLKICDNKLCY